MKAADLREKSVEDLRELEKTLAHDVFQNRLKNFTNRLDDTSLVRKSKRDLARVITLLRERHLGIARVAAPAKEEAPAEAKPAKKAAPKAEAKAAEPKAKKAVAKKASPESTKAKKAGKASQKSEAK
jgi:large subunit ribosomal protein L29